MAKSAQYTISAVSSSPRNPATELRTGALPVTFGNSSPIIPFTLELEGWRDAPPQRVVALLGHAFHDIAHGPAEPGSRATTPPAR
ncbi:hypothetical protein IFM12275_54480 [Nocardia sputorum]|nr:hypothetical protein IFM12275_54480 [Nocardia sputorum]